VSRVPAGLERFAHRSSLRTWMFAILVKCARRGAECERVPRRARRAMRDAFSAHVATV